MRDPRLYVAISLSLLCFLIAPFLHVLSAQMSGGGYKIQSDSINFGGGFSTSTNYSQESTLGEVATGNSTSTSYNLFGGYQQMQEVYIAIAAVADVTLSPSIGGVTGGTANGSTVVTVTTDSAAGYELTIKASSSPALVSGDDSFADYVPAVVGTPDFVFSIAASASEFAFTPEGTDIVQKFKDDGGACGVGSDDAADACWYGLSTSEETISERTSGNHPLGTATTIKFRASVGSSHLQPEGVYTATTTVTALPL